MTAINIFEKEVLRLYPDIDRDALSYLLEGTSTIQSPPRSIVIESGRPQRHLFFLTSGLARGYYIDNSGQDITIRFVDSLGWITHYSALLTDRPSQYTFQMLEMSDIVILPYELILSGYKRYKALERLGRIIAESVLLTQQRRIEQFQFDTAEQRYISFMTEYPTLYSRISITHLSTYLGITRQTLTRIRKKIHSA